ncbi:ribokinase [Anaerovirgula multivorans]|uniref:Deoxyribokinase n=2 Tax=Anaerovirgula multivorans TaxID=312168 RepID=A0A239FAS7_9FIRM|nr:ribokinase [Anaerovirgula multivorans]
MDYVYTVKELPRKGETLLVETFIENPGGKGANQAVAAKRLGAEVTMIGAIGKDIVGNKLKENLEKEGINVKNVKKVDFPSGNAMITVDQNGNNTILVYPGANLHIEKEDIDRCEGIIKDNDFIILQLEISIDTVLQAAKLGKKNNKKVILNPAPAKDLPEEIYQYIDYITPNETELTAMTGIEDIELAARELIKKGAKNVVVTLGEEGCYFLGKEELKVPSFKVEAIDTTAAGDSFNAALAIALGEGKEIEEALKFCNAVGAISTTKRGAQTSLPFITEVKNFYK